jgi:hypothetical protein
MNCKPGDIARIVGYPAHLGVLVDVLRPAMPGIDYQVGVGPAWWCRSLCRPLPTVCKGGVVRNLQERAIADRSLRPIRDPGDDAVDQFAREKPDTTLTPKRQLENTR